MVLPKVGDEADDEVCAVYFASRATFLSSRPTTMATGALTSWTRKPATLGPVIWTIERRTSSTLLALTRAARSTREVRNERAATSKNTVRHPTKNPTA